MPVDGAGVGGDFAPERGSIGSLILDF